jgi:NAD(P)-dependent dehydrogenase (short-subunit alcohol dehydrogenase family)
MTSPRGFKTAVVSGANGGLGKEIARGLAEAGLAATLACRSLEWSRRAEAQRAKTTVRFPPKSASIRSTDLP